MPLYMLHGQITCQLAILTGLPHISNEENPCPLLFESFIATMDCHLWRYKGPCLWALQLFYDFLYMKYSSNVKEQNIGLPIKGMVPQVLYLVDNSQSPSVVEQLWQGISFSCISFTNALLWLCGVSYALHLLPSLLQFRLEIIMSLGCSLGILVVP